MPHGDLAQLSAALGGLGAAAMLLSRSRAQVLAGLGLTAIAEGGLAAALIPGRDLKLLVSPPLHLVALVLGLLLVRAVAPAFVGYPAVVPIVLLAAAPLRVSVSVCAQEAYLLPPLCLVLAAAVLG